MKKLLLLALLSLFTVSCGSSKNNTTKKISLDANGKPNRTRTIQKKKSKDNLITTAEADDLITKESNKTKLDKIIHFAKSFKGTRYKFGGTTNKGMDCSGLVYTAFLKEDLVMPRISRDMATKGVEINLNEVTEGDLVFFKTGKRNRINHVGIIIENKRGEILFIHATTSKGVIISSMHNSYWKSTFVKVRRVL